MKIKGFTPFIDRVFKFYLEAGQSTQEAMITTLVFGAVYRYSNMRKRYCDASRETLAEAVGVSRKTVNRRLPVLCQDGFLEDLTPGKKNKPHIYIPTEMAEIVVTMEVGQGVPVNQEVGQAVPVRGTGSPSERDSLSLEETRVNHEETNMGAGSENQNGQVNDPTGLFTQDDLNRAVESEDGRKNYELDPASLFTAADKDNQRQAAIPKDNPAFSAFIALRPDYEQGQLLDNLIACQNDCGFEGDHAWLAACFLTYTGLPTSILSGEGKIARDARKLWRNEMDIYLPDHGLSKTLSLYHYAVLEMSEDNLSVETPRSIRGRVSQIIARSNKANGGKQYVPRQKRTV